MKLNFLNKIKTKKSGVSDPVQEKILAVHNRIYKPLSIFQAGPMADWLLLVGIGGLFLMYVLYDGWRQYHIYSEATFGTPSADIADTSVTESVEIIERFVNIRGGFYVSSQNTSLDTSDTEESNRNVETTTSQVEDGVSVSIERDTNQGPATLQ